jgi:hypothetical protein
MPNALAYIVLMSWPIVGLAMFATMPPARALLLTLLGGNLFIPPVVNIDLPLIPTLDKFSVSNLTALAGCVFMTKQGVKFIPQSTLVIVLLVIFVISPMATALTNGEPLIFVRGFVPGLSMFDGISNLLAASIQLIPFFLARHVLATAEDHKEILRAFMLAILIYAPLMLIEIRLSPQLNTWIYGFFQHRFDQMMRGGGFRPIVFMEHGLLVAIVTAFAVASAAALRREADAKSRGQMTMITAFLFGMLVLCKSMASLLYGLFMVTVLTLLGVKKQLLIAAVFASIVMSYPILRGGGFVPVDSLVESAESVNAERAQSLWFRFDNEDRLLERAGLKPVFGWGLWGRNQILDPTTGEQTSVTDGRWIIVIGSFGWVGYIAEFGLLCFPLILLYVRARSVPDAALSTYTGAVALILSVNLIDLLPNSPLRPFTWLMAGALLGFAERLTRNVPLPSASANAPLPTRPKRRTIL